MILTALAGFTSESMTREAAWRFLDMGRRLERALNTALVVEQALAAVRHDETPVLEALLDTADSAMTYRRRYRATLQVAPVVDLLAADEGNPRSILFQLAALAEHVAALPRDPTLARRSAGGADRVRGAVRVPPASTSTSCAPRRAARARRCASCCAAWSPTCSACPTRCRAATSRPRPCRARWPRRGSVARESRDATASATSPNTCTRRGVDLAPRAAPAAARDARARWCSDETLTVDARAGGAPRSRRLVRQPRRPTSRSTRATRAWR